MATITEREAWAFSLNVDYHHYRVVWLIATRVEDGYEEFRLIAYKDRQRFSGYKEDSDVDAALEAARAFRIRQLQETYSFGSSLAYYQGDFTVAKNSIVELAKRSWDNEFLGQYMFSWLYLDNVALILELSLGEVQSLVRELIAEKKLGINGAILIPFEDYEAELEEKEKLSGHKEIHYNQEGGWYCGFCGASGESQSGDHPLDFPCIQTV